MTHHHHQPTQSRGSGDERDRALDAVLARYAAVEPRAGLENRILASVRAERSRYANQARCHARIWHWGWAAVMAAIVVTLAATWTWTRTWTWAWTWTSKSQKQSAVINLPNVAAPARQADSELSPSQTGRRDVNVVAARKSAPTRRVIAMASRNESSPADPAANPKLDQFPSPRPLSEQEQILARYIAQNPERATLVAEARMQALQEIREEERQAVSEEADDARGGDRRSR